MDYHCVNDLLKDTTKFYVENKMRSKKLRRSYNEDKKLTRNICYNNCLKASIAMLLLGLSYGGLIASYVNVESPFGFVALSLTTPLIYVFYPLIKLCLSKNYLNRVGFIFFTHLISIIILNFLFLAIYFMINFNYIVFLPIAQLIISSLVINKFKFQFLDNWIESTRKDMKNED